MRRALVVVIGIVSGTAACTSDQDLGDRHELFDDGGLPLGDDEGNSGSVTDDEDTIGSEPLDGTGGDNIDDEGSSTFGSFEPFESASMGLFTTDFGGEPVVGMASEAGAVGCALVGSLQSSPGRAGARLLIFTGSGTDRRCPEGVHPVSTSESNCSFGANYAGCALYERWDEDGKPVARVAPSGGAVSISAEELEDDRVVCTVELDVRFAGGKSVVESFSFEYDPFAPREQFCVH